MIFARIPFATLDSINLFPCKNSKIHLIFLEEAIFTIYFKFWKIVPWQMKSTFIILIFSFRFLAYLFIYWHFLAGKSGTGSGKAG
jgi:hypothetical protein